MLLQQFSKIILKRKKLEYYLLYICSCLLSYPPYNGNFLFLVHLYNIFSKDSNMRLISNPIKSASSAFPISPNRKLLVSKSPKSNLPTPRSRFQLSQKSIKLANLRKKPVMQEESKEFLLHVENDQLFADLNLFHVKGKLQRFQNSIVDEKKELFVLSKIQDFYMQYNDHFNHIYAKAKSVVWLIISNAVNSRQIWQEFSSTYEPIKFIFLKNIQEAINYFNFGYSQKEVTTKKLSQFSKIVNFEAYQNSFAYIDEHSLQQNDYLADKSEQLWLISKQKLKQICIIEHNFYYIGQQSFTDDGIEINISNQENITFVLVAQNYSACLHHSIKQLESSMKGDQIKQAIFHSKSPKYLQKVIRQYLNQQLILNIIGFSEDINNIFFKNFKYIISCDQIGLIENSYIYKIYADSHKKIEYPYEEIVQLQGNDAQRQIKQLCMAYTKLFTLKKEYKKNLNKFNAYVIISFRLGLKEKIKIQELLCKQIEQIKYLRDAKEYALQDQPIIILGQFMEKQVESFSNYPNISFLNFKGCVQNVISYYEKLLAMFTRDINQPKIIFNQTIVTNFSEQIDQLQIKQAHLYSYRKIDTFLTFLSQVELKSSHLIIMGMNDYTEEREAKLKQSQLTKESKFQVYLLYGNQFICRSQGTYTFLKKDQIIKKIKDIINERRSFNNNRNQSYTQHIENGYLSLLDYQVKSDILCYSIQENNYDQFLSTPNLVNYFPMHKKEVIICIPKSIPHHSLLDRSINPYTLLVYTSIDQVLQLTKYEAQDIYIVVIGPQLQGTYQKMIFTSKQHCEYITAIEPSQKNCRGIIDNLIDRFELGRKIGSMIKKINKSPFILLFNHLDQKQVKIMGLVHSLFKNSKIIAMSKKQFKNIKKLYGISSHIQTYELGKAQIGYAKRLKTIIDIFKLYMAPNIVSHDFSGQTLNFSVKQLFLRSFFQNQKKRRMGKINQSRAHRSQSPKGKNILQKQAFLWQHGMIFLQSAKINKLMKKQKFNSYNQLISLTLFHLAKGSQILVVIQQQQFFEMKNQVEIYENQILWVVMSQDKKKYIIRQKNIVFCKQQQLETTLNTIIVNYRNWKEAIFTTKFENNPKKSQLFFEKIDSYKQNKNIKVNIYTSYQQSQSKKPQLFGEFNILLLNNQKHIQMKSLKNNLIFTDKCYLEQYLDSHQVPISNNNDSNLDRIHFVCNQRNLRFLQQTLALIKELNFIIITFFHTSQLISYSIQGKSIFIIQSELAKIKCENAIFIQSSDTANNFCLKLKVFIEAIRKIN